MTFKEKLVILRKSKGLTQDEFASAVGVSRQAVYKWESGQSYPEVPKLLEIKMLFTISIDELLDDSYDIPVPEKKKRKRAPKVAATEAPAAPAPKAEPVAKVAPAVPAPKAEPVAKVTPAAPAAPAPKAEPVAKAAPAAPAAPAPKAEPVAKVAPAAPAPKAEPVAKAAPAAPAAPAPKAEPKVDSVPSPTEIDLNDLKEADESTKKTSFFGRLFNRK